MDALFISRHTIVAGYYGITLAVVRPSVHILFPADNLSKCQLILIKLGVYIDIVEIWFGIVNGQISLILKNVADLGGG